MGVVLLFALSLFIPHTTGPETNTPPDDPDLRLAPLPQLEIQTFPILEPIKEPLPLPKIKQDGDPICTDDCPLIEVATSTVEKEVRAFYADVPVLVAIAKCESEFTHYDTAGNVLMNKEGSSATGVMQIMASVHQKEAEKLGWSIRDLHGNMAYARHLYEQSGTKPWEASRYCWGSSFAAVYKGISDV